MVGRWVEETFPPLTFGEAGREDCKWQSCDCEALQPVISMNGLPSAQIATVTAGVLDL